MSNRSTDSNRSTNRTNNINVKTPGTINDGSANSLAIARARNDNRPNNGQWNNNNNRRDDNRRNNNNRYRWWDYFRGRKYYNGYYYNGSYNPLFANYYPNGNYNPFYSCMPTYWFYKYPYYYYYFSSPCNSWYSYYYPLNNPNNLRYMAPLDPVDLVDSSTIAVPNQLYAVPAIENMDGIVDTTGNYNLSYLSILCIIIIIIVYLFL